MNESAQPRFQTVATILGDPNFYTDGYRAHAPRQLEGLAGLGVNTVFVNLAWSRPWIDAVTLEEVVVSPSFAWLSDGARIADNAARLQARAKAVHDAGLRPFFLFGCPRQLNLGSVPPEAHDTAQELIGAPTSRIDPRLAVACINSPAVRHLYRELLGAFFALVPQTAGLLIYTMDELAEVCDENDDCPRCRGIPLHERLPDFLLFLKQTIDELRPGVELWWEPWEFTAGQTYAMVERIDPSIRLALHSNLHEVYFVNRADLWFRHLCRLAYDRGIGVIAEVFYSGGGEDLGPIASFPCPRLVYEQLRSVAELPAVVGVKEYFGTVWEHISANERVLRAMVPALESTWDAVLASLLAPYGPEAAAFLSPAWEAASRALENFPWALSWRMRQYNSWRYDQHGEAGYWDVDFVSTLLTPWTTPSWESSRLQFYVVAFDGGVVRERLLDETAAQLQRCIADLDTAAALLAQAAAQHGGHGGELQRQEAAVRIFRNLALSRCYHLEAGRLARAARAAPGAELHDRLDRCLAADLGNAHALLSLARSSADHALDIAALEHTVGSMARDLQSFRDQPEAWLDSHLPSKGAA